MQDNPGLWRYIKHARLGWPDDCDEWEALPEYRQVAVVLEFFACLVWNGGLSQWFVSPMGSQCDILLHCLMQVGATRAASLVEEFLVLVPGYAEMDDERRLAVMANMSESLSEREPSLSDAVSYEVENVYVLADQWMLRNAPDWIDVISQ